MSPSKFHSYLQIAIGTAFAAFPQFSIFSNLTIDIGGVDYIPDICVYPKMTLNFYAADEVRMTTLPVMLVEIVSPTQTLQEVLDKFPVYFTAGIQSCWLLIPQAKTIVVHTANAQAHSFAADDEVVDPVLDIRIPLAQIFA